MVPCIPGWPPTHPAVAGTLSLRSSCLYHLDAAGITDLTLSNKLTSERPRMQRGTDGMDGLAKSTPVTVPNPSLPCPDRPEALGV